MSGLPCFHFPFHGDPFPPYGLCLFFPFYGSPCSCFLGRHCWTVISIVFFFFRTFVFPTQRPLPFTLFFPYRTVPPVGVYAPPPPLSLRHLNFPRFPPGLFFEHSTLFCWCVRFVPPTNPFSRLDPLLGEPLPPLILALSFLPPMLYGLQGDFLNPQLTRLLISFPLLLFESPSPTFSLPPGLALKLARNSFFPLGCKCTLCNFPPLCGVPLIETHPLRL